MIKDDFGTGTLFRQFELGNRIDTGIPIDNTPRLDDSLIRYEAALPSSVLAPVECSALALLAATCASVDIFLGTPSCVIFAPRVFGQRVRFQARL